MASNPRLTDAEVCRKFGITRSDPSFRTARGLSDNRHDRVICEVPDIQCPHCCHKFTATWWDSTADNLQRGDSIACPGCERTIYVEHITTLDDDDFDAAHIFVTLNTDPE